MKETLPKNESSFVWDNNYDSILEKNDKNVINLDKILDSFLEEYKAFIDSVKIDNVNIDEVIMDYPARKARYAIALERLRASLSEKKLELKKLYYELYTKYKKESIEKGFKTTEEYLKALIYTSDEYINFTKEIIELEKKVGILEACKETLDDLGRMLYLICGNTNNFGVK